MRRKQLQKILRSAQGYELSPDQVAALEKEVDYELTLRPEQLSAAQFVELSGKLRQLGYPKEDAES